MRMRHSLDCSSKKLAEEALEEIRKLTAVIEPFSALADIIADLADRVKGVEDAIRESEW